MGRHNVRGFTLIELIAVIVILGVLATATTKFIVFGTQVYVDGQSRQQTLSQSRFVVERLSREIKGAIPNSVRIGTNGVQACIEFTPIKASGAYRDDVNATVAPPIEPSAANDQMDVISWEGLNRYENGDRLYIYPTQSSDIYDPDPSNVDKVTTLLSATLGDADPEYLLTFIADDQFVEASEINRYYTADHSVSYCLIANAGKYDVYRFVFTGFTEDQLFPAANAGVLMAEGLTNVVDNLANSRFPFKYREGALFSNAVVNLYLEFQSDINENMFFNQEVHIPNVP